MCSDMHNYLPDNGKDYDIRMNWVNKVNLGKRDQLSIRKKGLDMTPCVYLDTLYQEYAKDGRPIEEIMTMTARDIVSFQKDALEDPLFKQAEIINTMDYEQLKDMIFVSAIGAQRNSGLLETIPHKQMGDICAVYRIHLNNDPARRATVLINNQMMERMGVSPDELHRRAVENSMNCYPAVCRPLGDLISDMLGTSDPFEPEDMMPVYVLSNSELIDGAAAIFYPGVAETLQKKLPEGFYVLPSSTQELLIVPKNRMDKADLERMVHDVNANEVDPSEQLSDFVHEYDPRQKVLFTGETPPVPQVQPALEERDRSL